MKSAQVNSSGHQNASFFQFLQRKREPFLLLLLLHGERLCATTGSPRLFEARLVRVQSKKIKWGESIWCRKCQMGMQKKKQEQIIFLSVEERSREVQGMKQQFHRRVILYFLFHPVPYLVAGESFPIQVPYTLASKNVYLWDFCLLLLCINIKKNLGGFFSPLQKVKNTLFIVPTAGFDPCNNV